MSTDSDEMIIETEGVKVNFGDFWALKGVDIKVRKGEIIVILGPSGSGKSTFIRTLNRLQPHSGGTITTMTMMTTQMMKTQMRRSIPYITGVFRPVTTRMLGTSSLNRTTRSSARRSRRLKSALWAPYHSSRPSSRHAVLVLRSEA